MNDPLDSKIFSYRYQVIARARSINWKKQTDIQKILGLSMSKLIIEGLSILVPQKFHVTKVGVFHIL